MKNSHNRFISVILIAAIVYVQAVPSVHVAFAATDPAAALANALELQQKINSHQATISSLEKEIAGYQSQVDALGKQSSSLKTTLAGLALSKKKLEASLKITQNKIEETNLQIQQLQSGIVQKQTRISSDQDIVARALRLIQESGDSSLAEIILKGKSISVDQNIIQNLAQLQADLKAHISTLNDARTALVANKATTEQKKADLIALQNNLSAQKAIILSTTQEQNTLLAQTKDNEVTYQKMLADKVAQKAAFEAELLSYENQLHFNVNASLLPQTGSGVLHWPLDKITITQYFGNTDFSTANPQIYNGKGHTGVDFAASIGTPVKAALDGTVVGMANTDIVRGCYSFGKWVMVKHPNGLSTLYAHLSLQSVSIGQTVSTGDVLGYSGKTGYATGPHLHFGVYATDGVRITTLTPSQSVHCKGATLPLADLKAYLNPLSYL